MSDYQVLIKEVNIEEHPNADALEVAQIDGYKCIVQKGLYESGDLVAYIPEGGVLPDWMIERMGLEGKLAGSNKNRVKPIRLRGIFSQGLCYPVEKEVPSRGISNAILVLGEDNKFHHHVVTKNDDVTDLLGITKYEPPIPVQMQGEVEYGTKYTVKFDVENIKKYPDFFSNRDKVVITEKLHGTFTGLGYHPDLGSEQPCIFSKGLGAKGLRFKNNDVNNSNVYVRNYHRQTINDKTLVDRIIQVFGHDLPVFVLGETFGNGIQDLDYGQKEIDFRAFMVIVNGKPLPYNEFVDVTEKLKIQRVPELYVGLFSQQEVDKLTSGKETITSSHMREGVVVSDYQMEKPVDEFKFPILKSVSEQYLSRKNATEFN